MSTSKEERVELGYCETTDAYRLESHFFASKVGGKPSWLALADLPDAKLNCRVCAKRMVFLLQVYAPLAKSNDCFHRTLFVFICRDPTCCQPNTAANMIVLRSQLPRVNKFYADTPLDPDSWDPEKVAVKRASDYQSLCRACGCAGELSCASCGSVRYCCKLHQEIDWKTGGHKTECKKMSAGDAKSASQPSEKEKEKSDDKSALLFPECELITEKEEFVAPAKQKERSESERIAEYQQFIQSKKQSSDSTNANQKFSDEELYQFESAVKKADKDFKLFRQRVEQNPEQVLRYSRGGKPLWATGHIPRPADIPRCSCGAKRIFEFQLLPHLLTYMEVDTLEASIDWASVAIFTCEESCASAEPYIEEFVWKQDFCE